MINFTKITCVAMASKALDNKGLIDAKGVKHVMYHMNTSVEHTIRQTLLMAHFKKQPHLNT